jgi:hypothetical protein
LEVVLLSLASQGGRMMWSYARERRGRGEEREEVWGESKRGGMEWSRGEGRCVGVKGHVSCQ